MCVRYFFHISFYTLIIAFRFLYRSHFVLPIIFDMLKTNRKEANYLLHRLANAVVVIDELQTYNPLLWDKMYYLIEHYARFFQVRFILMSATLPKIGKLRIPLK